ncbi:MAG TPA: choice-of-anchor Q domain-containing protein [Solirubrobacteraceae bacterium]|nr:choice-of-anchor Q domain-containing protein [Solirubrobacteraceae bacterium]
MLVSIVTIALTLMAAPAANAARRFAAPAGSTTAACTAADPCALQTAVNSAAVGDEVVVTPGTYALAKKLVPRGELDIHGDPDFASPRIVGAGGLKEPLLTLDGGTLTHVFIRAAANKEALVLKEGVVDRTWLESANGDAATVYGSDRTVIRNSVVKSMGPIDSAALWLRDGSGADSVEIRNVTAMATAGTANGIHCDITNGSAAIVNSIARGTGYDLDFTPGCDVSYSNYRPESSTGVTAGIGNQSAEPLFADGDYRPAAGSPTIDAGALDTRGGSVDPDGHPRMLGTAPDIGAYEFSPPATGDGGGAAEPELPDDLKGVPLPKQGRSVVVATERGTVRVRVPGSDRFVDLDEAGRVPVGSLIDARRGRVRLATAVDGGVQAGTFWGSTFKTGQSRHGNGMTTLKLRGGTLCPSASLAVASRKAKRKRKRGLWGRDHGGLYRTRGNDSVATVRGTRWLTKDRCDGTLTRVKRGVVSVRDLRRDKSVLVKAGHSYFARSR